MGKKSLENRLNDLENNAGGTSNKEELRALEKKAIDAFIAAFDAEKSGTADAVEAEKRLETVNDEIEELGGEPYIEVFPGE